MILTRKLQIHPSKKAKKRLWDVSVRCTELWNAGLNQRKDKKTWGKLNVYTQKKELPELKKECPEFKTPSSQVLQSVLFSLDSAYKMFFTKWQAGDKNVRPPRFKSRQFFFTQEYSQPKTSFDLNVSGKLALAYGKGKKDWIQIDLPDMSTKSVKTVSVKYDDLAHKWYALLAYEITEKPKITEGEVIYFDPGCKTALTGISTKGEFVEYDINPLRALNLSTYKLIDELKSEKDKLKKKGSHKWCRLNKRIKKLHRKLNTRSKTYLHTLANHILNAHGTAKAFMIGNWKKQETLADTGFTFVNRSINRAVQNNNPLMKLIEILKYKSKLRGQTVQKFNERGTTRTCSRCNYVKSEGLSPSKRKFNCESCGFSYSRDHQSCLNFIKRFEPAVWLRLPDILSGRSVRMALSPFAFKPQRSIQHVGILQASL